MTLSEVAKTGRRFRRLSEPEHWYTLAGMSMCDLGGAVTITAEMLVGNDWEAEPLALSLTAQDVIRAARQLDEITSKRRVAAAEFGKMIAIELGLMERT